MMGIACSEYILRMRCGTKNSTTSESSLLAQRSELCLLSDCIQEYYEKKIVICIRGGDTKLSLLAYVTSCIRMNM